MWESLEMVMVEEGEGWNNGGSGRDCRVGLWTVR